MWWHTVTHGRGKWRGNWRMEWVASTLHTTSEHGVSSITTADAHTSAASSRLNWRPRRFIWTRPFRRRRNLVSARVPSHFKGSLRTLIIFSSVQLKCDGTRWLTGREVKGKLANVLGSQYSSHYLGTWCIQHHYRWCAHLGCQQLTELTPPGQFKWTRPFRARDEICFLLVCHHISTDLYVSVFFPWHTADTSVRVLTACRPIRVASDRCSFAVYIVMKCSAGV